MVDWGKQSRWINRSRCLPTKLGDWPNLQGIRTVKLASLTGFPDHMLLDIHSMAMGEVISQTSVLALCCRTTPFAVTATTSQANWPERVSNKEDVQPSKGQCFRCQGLLMVRDCKKPKPRVICYRCKQTSHIATGCM